MAPIRRATLWAKKTHELPPFSVILTLKSLGIFRRRGKSAGKKINKPQLPAFNIARYTFPSVYLTNATSVNNKLDELSAVANNYEVGVISVTETWENQKSNISLPGFNCFSSPRSKRPGGGVATYIRDTISAFPLKTIIPQSFEFDYIWTFVRPKKLPREISGIIIGNIYLPAGWKPETGRLLFDFICQSIDKFKIHYPNAGILLVGDYNRWNHKTLCGIYKLTQVVNFPTFYNGSGETETLDLIMTDMKKFYSKPQCLAPLGKSHHMAILMNPLEVIKSPLRKKTTVSYRPLSTQGYSRLMYLLKNETWEEVLNACNTNSKDMIWHNIMHVYINISFPIKEKTIYENDKPWITAEIRKCIRLKQKLFSKRDPQWKVQVRRILKLIKTAKLQFRSKLSDKFVRIGDQGWYKCVKNILGNAPKSVLNQIRLIEGFSEKNDIEIANTVNHHFSTITNTETPLHRKLLPCFLPSEENSIVVTMEEVYKRLRKLSIHKSTSPQSIPSAILQTCALELCYVISHILNSSYNSGCVPDSWRKGFIAVLPKVSHLTSLNDLRPVAVTSNIAKLAEYFVHKQLMNGIIPHISNSQFGVLPKRSTTHYLVNMIDFLLKSLDKKSTPAVLTMLDCQKAFDMVDHTIIINRLISLGINGYIINWITSFLSNRLNCVRVGKIMSKFLPMGRGLAQGTLNGPLSFILVFDPFLQELQNLDSQNLQVYGFVDDATAAAIETNIPHPITQNILSEAPLAADRIKMKLNAKKTQVIIIDFTKTRKSNDWAFTLNDTHVETVPSARLLGVIVNNKLTWEDHVSSIVKKASGRLWTLRLLRQFGFSKHELITLYKSSIIPILEYASPVWSPGLTTSQSESIERIQWRAVQIIYCKRIKMMSIEYEQALADLNLSKLCKRREELAFTFGMSLLSNPIFCSWLPPITTGKSRLRKFNLLTPVKTRTARYKNSTIPYLVDLINEKFKSTPDLFYHINIETN